MSTDTNTVIQTSVSKCNATSYEDTMDNRYGFINFSTVNLSHNKVETSYSAIYCYPSKISNSYYTSITYSSFANNTAGSSRCIYLGNNNYDKEINNSNIIRNNGEYTIVSAGNTYMTECCIRDNYVDGSETMYYFQLYSSSSSSSSSIVQ